VISAAPELLDQLMADGLALRVFMLQVSIELSRAQPDPNKWATTFVQTLHERIDANESNADDATRRFPFHELARTRIDSLGKDLRAILQLPPS
jgi:hypothetical protein